MNGPKFETLAIHAGAQPDPSTGARATPIYQTTSFVFDDVDHAASLFGLQQFGNIYTRIMNPTNAVLEERMTQLEGGVGALAVASGMAAITYALQTICTVGTNIVSTSQLYGGTYNLFAHTLPNQGIEVRMADGRNPQAIADAIDEKTKMPFRGESFCSQDIIINAKNLIEITNANCRTNIIFEK